MYRRSKTLKGLMHQADRFRVRCLIALKFAAIILLAMASTSELPGQISIRYGDYLVNTVQCGTTSTFTFQGNPGDVVVIHVIEMQDYGGVCNGIACFCFDQKVELLDPENNVFAVNSSPDGNNTRNYYRTKIGPEVLPMSGTYKLTVRDKQLNGRGEIAIFIQRINDPLRAISISSEQSLLVNLNRGETDSYQFEARPLDRIKIEMTQGSVGNIDPVLELYDQKGKAIALPDSGFIDQVTNCGGKFNLLAYSRTDQSGTYKLSLKIELKPNIPPEANDDFLSTDKNTDISINVLANDSDPDGNFLKVTSVSKTGNGTAFTNGSYVVYRPDKDFVGSDEFIYHVTDFRDTSAARVSVTVNSVTGIDNSSELEMGFALISNYPNPFGQVTHITYKLPAQAEVRIVVCNSMGQEVATLDYGLRSQGSHEIEFDATGLCSGIYICIVESASFRAFQRMVLLNK